jgi:hypothetical protein
LHSLSHLGDSDVRASTTIPFTITIFATTTTNRNVNNHNNYKINRPVAVGLLMDNLINVSIAKTWPVATDNMFTVNKGLKMLRNEDMLI